MNSSLNKSRNVRLLVSQESLQFSRPEPWQSRCSQGMSQTSRGLWARPLYSPGRIFSDCHSHSKAIKLPVWDIKVISHSAVSPRGDRTSQSCSIANWTFYGECRIKKTHLPNAGLSNQITYQHKSNNFLVVSKDSGYRNLLSQSWRCEAQSWIRNMWTSPSGFSALKCYLLHVLVC